MEHALDSFARDLEGRSRAVLERNSMDRVEQCLDLWVIRFLAMTAIQQALDRDEHLLLFLRIQRSYLLHLLGNHALDCVGQFPKLLNGLSNLLLLLVR
jgi:hypothetical protein